MMIGGRRDALYGLGDLGGSLDKYLPALAAGAVGAIGGSLLTKYGGSLIDAGGAAAGTAGSSIWSFLGKVGSGFAAAGKGFVSPWTGAGTATAPSTQSSQIPDWLKSQLASGPKISTPAPGTTTQAPTAAQSDWMQKLLTAGGGLVAGGAAASGLAPSSAISAGGSFFGSQQAGTGVLTAAEQAARAAQYQPQPQGGGLLSNPVVLVALVGGAVIGIPLLSQLFGGRGGRRR